MDIHAHIQNAFFQSSTKLANLARKHPEKYKAIAEKIISIKISNIDSKLLKIQKKINSEFTKIKIPPYIKIEPKNAFFWHSKTDRETIARRSAKISTLSVEENNLLGKRHKYAVNLHIAQTGTTDGAPIDIRTLREEAIIKRQ
ncbi:hypothetical protein [Burkholderia lata]|uniref:hypothetical protein n=1 Tax=Burkholderia lata (strain ATCC 17760 / DSM 23089 / LMG 22485 / NCIMB 9086 / R18194 / 383) TaxID=482957 RepID=UPI00399B967C